MKKIYIVFGIILMALLVLGCSGTNNTATDSKSDNSHPSTTEQAVQTEEQPALTIVNSTLVKEDYGGYSVKGTAIANKDLSYAQIDAQFSDSDGALVGSFFTNINNIKAGTPWKFKIIGPMDSSVKVATSNVTMGTCY